MITARLGSGNDQYEIVQVGLYVGEKVAEISRLLTNAQKKLGGVSTGIGFWGSPSLALGGALLVGAIENFASNIAAQEGIRLIAEARSLLFELPQHRKMFDVSDISHISLPQPDIWEAGTPGGTEIDLNEMDGFQIGLLLERHNRTAQDIKNGKLSISGHRTYVHSGEFLYVKAQSGECNIRWSSVTAWKVG